MLEFFCDRNLGAGFVATLVDAGFKVHVHHDYFLDNTPDDEWLPIVAQRGWIVLSLDQFKKGFEREIARRSHSQVVVVKPGKFTQQEMAEHFVNNRARIERSLLNRTAPYVATLYAPAPAELRRQKPKIEIKFLDF